MRRPIRWFAVLIGIVLAAVAVDWAMRCHGSPLARDEAIVRAKARVEKFKHSHGTGLVESLEMRDIVFEADSGSWRATFVGSNCEVAVIVDRCRGDDIGGATGCSTR